MEIIRGSTETLTVEIEAEGLTIPETDRIIVTIASGSYTLNIEIGSSGQRNVVVLISIGQNV